MKAILDLPAHHTEVLSLLVQRVPPAESLWSLTGSAGLRLQGVDVPLHDLDLQTNGQVIYRLEKELAEFIKIPLHLWETEHTLSCHGQAEVNGLQVELLGDIRHRGADGTWDKPLDIRFMLVWVEWSGLSIPVSSLAHEAVAYEKMGRMQKAQLIRSAIQKATL